VTLRQPLLASCLALSLLSILPSSAQGPNSSNFRLRDWSVWGPLAETSVLIDPSTTNHGAKVAVIDSGATADKLERVGIYQEFKADKYRGKRLALSADLKTVGKGAWSGLWMTVEDENGKGVAFDNMENRPVKAAGNWQVGKVVLDVPAGASAVMIGCALHGRGKALVSAVALTEVGKKVKTTAVAVDDKKYPVAGRVGDNANFSFANGAGAIDDNLKLTGWGIHASRQYAVDADSEATAKNNGKSSGHIKSLQDDASGFATIYQTVSATKYRGKKVKFSARVKTRDVEDWAGLWMRIDGGGKVQAFDNMEKRPVKGSTDWAEYSVVLNAPANAYSLKAGLMLAGKGQAWINDCNLEVASGDASLTAGPVEPFTIPRPELLETPHLEFEHFAEK
jgi:hypothetical protein